MSKVVKVLSYLVALVAIALIGKSSQTLIEISNTVSDMFVNFSFLQIMQFLLPCSMK